VPTPFLQVSAGNPSGEKGPSLMPTGAFFGASAVPVSVADRAERVLYKSIAGLSYKLPFDRQLVAHILMPGAYCKSLHFLSV
jgi:hypothetical protein